MSIEGRTTSLVNCITIDGTTENGWTLDGELKYHLDDNCFLPGSNIIAVIDEQYVELDLDEIRPSEFVEELTEEIGLTEEEQFYIESLF